MTKQKLKKKIIAVIPFIYTIFHMMNSFIEKQGFMAAIPFALTTFHTRKSYKNSKIVKVSRGGGASLV